MDHVALGGFQKSLLFPGIIRDMITPYPQVKVILRYPEEGEDMKFIVLVNRGKNQHVSPMAV